MQIKQSAMAGTLESSDVQVTIEPHEGSVEIELESSVMLQYGRQIKACVQDTLKRLNVNDVRVTVVDKAPECTIKARVQCAVYRAAEWRRAFPGEVRSNDTRKRMRRLRRSMMFLNAQRPALIKDAYIYKPDSLMLDLEDAVAENQKDAARFSLYNALKSVDYRGVERIVRINGLDTRTGRRTSV